MIIKRRIATLAGATKVASTSESAVIANLDTVNTIYVGSIDATAATGFPILPNKSYSFSTELGNPLYIFCNAVVNVLILEDLPGFDGHVPMNMDLKTEFS